MEKNIIVKDTEIDFSDYYEQKNISMEVQSKFESANFLAVPYKYEQHEYYFAQETIDFLKFCRSQSPEYSFDVLAEDDIQIRSLHSFDIWMPVIWVASSVLLPFVINMVSSYIYDKMRGREKEDVNVDVTFLVKRDNEEKYIHYSGDAKTFKESFEKIDLNKM